MLQQCVTEVGPFLFLFNACLPWPYSNKYIDDDLKNIHYILPFLQPAQACERCSLSPFPLSLTTTL